MIKAHLRIKGSQALAARYEDFSGPEDRTDKNFVFFTTGHIGILICHGSAKGTFIVADRQFTTKTFLAAMKPMMARNNVNTIFTISCHGGTQQTAESDGFVVDTLHHSRNNIIWNKYAGFSEFTIEFDSICEYANLKSLCEKISFQGTVHFEVIRELS